MCADYGRSLYTRQEILEYDQIIWVPFCHFDISDFDGFQPEEVKRFVEKHAQACSSKIVRLWKKKKKNQNNFIMSNGLMKYSVSVSTKIQVLVLSSFGKEVVLVHL